MAAKRFVEGFSSVLSQFSFITKVAWTIVAVMFALYFVFRSPFSFNGTRAPTKIAESRNRSLTAGNSLPADPLLIKPDVVFCTTLSDIYSLKMYLNNGDNNATTGLFDRGACIMVKPSGNVHIIEEKGDILCVHREGMSRPLWTFRSVFALSRK